MWVNVPHLRLAWRLGARRDHAQHHHDDREHRRQQRADQRRVTGEQADRDGGDTGDGERDEADRAGELLLNYLREEVHIWHFVGHGGMSSDGGHLLFEDATSPGDAEAIPAHWLVAALSANQPTLVVLDACNSGRVVNDNAIWSMAPALAYGAVPAVVAMQLPMADDAARAFAAEFYKELARGQIVEVVNAGRLALVLHTRSLRTGWGIPVVYTRGEWDERQTPPSINRQIDPVARGFRSLGQLSSDPDVYATTSAVFNSRSNVRLVTKQISELAEYKQLHDLLHEMQDSFNTIAVERERLLADPRAWIDIARREPELFTSRSAACST